jgi:hypothetical protein
MSSGPTLWSSLTEHLRLARRLRGLQIHFYPEKCTGVCNATPSARWVAGRPTAPAGWRFFMTLSGASPAVPACCNAHEMPSS